MGKKKAIMRKKVLSCFIILVILMSVVPVSAFAAVNPNISSDGVDTTKSTPQDDTKSLREERVDMTKVKILADNIDERNANLEALALLTKDNELSLVNAAFLGTNPQILIATAPRQTYPIDGDSYIVLSTGDAMNIEESTATTFISTDLAGRHFINAHPRHSNLNTFDVATLRIVLSVPENAKQLSFKWQYGSEEIPSYLNSDFMDYFIATLTLPSGAIIDITNMPNGEVPTVDTVSEFTNIPSGSSDNPSPPFPIPNDVALNAMTTAASKQAIFTPFTSVVDVRRLRGQQITITFEVGDAGDGVFDTAVFLDDLGFDLGEEILIEPGSLTFGETEDGKVNVSATFFNPGNQTITTAFDTYTGIMWPNGIASYNIEETKSITREASAAISETFTVNLPVLSLDVSGYLIGIKRSDVPPQTPVGVTNQFKLFPIASIKISPENIVTSIGGSAKYEIAVKNPCNIALPLNLSLTGLDDSWYMLGKESLILNAGEEETVILNVTIPESPDIVGEYSFNVFAGAKSVSAVLNVDLEPIIYELSPPNDVVVSSNDIIFSWKTSVNSTTELYIKSETEADFTQVSGDSGLEHSVTVGDLTRNTNYIWHIRSCTAFGCAVSEDRAFYIDNGIVFTQDIYEFSVKRDYDQHCFVSVENRDTEAHDLLVRTSNPYDDLYYGFIGGGSADKIISLAPKETKEIELVIHAQDAMLEDYTFAVNLTNLGAENITDYALVHLHVPIPHIDYDITEVSTDPITMSKTIRITNQGDPVTDLSLTPDEKLKGDVIIQPSLAHCSLGTGESVDIVISPIWSEGIRYIHGSVAATVADQSRELSVDYSCGEGKEMYEVTLNHPILYYDLRGAWCINCHHVEDVFNLPPGFGQENVVYAYIGMELAARSGQTRPYNVYIAVNGHSVGTLSNTFPRGYYEFDIDSSYLNYATAGTAENRYTLDTDMPGSYMTPLSNVRVVMCVDGINLYICAESAEQAEEIAWSAPYIQKPSGSITVNILSPEEERPLNLNQPVLIKAEVLGDSGREKWCTVTATFNNSHVVIPLVDNGLHDDGQADDGVYAAEWIPQIPGWCTITVNATNCRGYDSDNVPVLVGLPVEREINLNLTIEDAYTDPVVYKAPGDAIDIVAGVTNKGTIKQDVDITINVTPHSYFDLVTTFCRDNFTDLEEEPIDCVDQGNSRYSVRIEDLESDAEKQVVFRLNISANAPTRRYEVGGEARVGGELNGSDLVTFDVVDIVPGIIVTNRHLLYKKYGHDLKSQNPDSVKDVKTLLKYLYEVADGEDSGEKACIIYYVDHYNETLKNWNASDITDADYTAGESVVNKNANAIDDLIEKNFTKKTDPDYLMIVGGDEVIPYYRADDPTDVEDKYMYFSDDPVLDAMDHDYFISDDIYADIDDKDWDKGELELITSRIVGCSAQDMECFIGNGIKGPVNNDNATVASLTEAGGREWDADWAIAELEKKKTITDKDILNDNHNWGQNELINALQNGFQVFAYFAHGEYNEYQTPNLRSNEIDIVDSNGCISNNRPFIANDGCRLGIVTDEDGATWIPEWDDCMMYALVHHGISGAFGSGGIMWWWTGADVAYYGELFGNDFFEELIINTGTTTLPVGEAFMQSKVNYNPKDPNFDNYDKKTMMEYILYGIPWMTMDPKISEDSWSQEDSSQVSVKISDPIYLSDENYSKLIEVNVTDFDISHLNGFDVISIEGAEQKGGILKPEIPTATVSILLPPNSVVTEVKLIDNVTTYLGEFNIPCSGVIAGTNAIGYTNETDVVGYYPVPTYTIDISAIDDYQLVRVYVALIQHNPQTKETILYNYTKLELSYQTPVPITITDFSPAKTEYVTGEPINTSLTVENVGSDALTGLQANLSLKDLYGVIRASSLSAPFDVAPGESKTVYATVSQNLPHGSYLAEIQVINSTGCILGSSSEHIFITSGSIVDFFLPSEVVAREDITCTIRFKNARTSGVEATGVVNIYDSSDMKIAEVYSDPTNIAADSTGAMSFTWNTGGNDIGLYTASAVVHVGEETFGPVSDTFTIILSDTTPPRITEVRTGNITAKSGDTINFNCLVTDNIAVESVRLGHTTNNWTTSNVTPMDNPHDDFYTTTLTLPLEAGALNYKIEATDTAGSIGCSIIYTITALKGIVLFDESHEEIFSIAPNAKYSYSKLASLLEPRGYEAKTLDSIPITKEKLTNCSIFVISAPTKPFDTSEINAIQEFVSNNGSLLLINEWGGDFRQGSNLNEIAENFGIVFKNDLVNDPTNNFHNTPSYALIHEFSRHYITKGVNEFLYPAGCSLIANNSIARADDDSYTTLPNIPMQAMAKEERGSIAVLAATNFESGRVVCIGDGDFCGDLDIDGDGRANIDEYDNKNLTLNIVTWLAQREINELPVASFSYPPPKLFVNQTITFNASSSYDPDGTIENYSWEFGDGAIGTGEIVTYSYSATGTYNVTLTVTDNDGATNKETEKIEVVLNATYVPDDYPKIQAAVDAARAGDTIIVRDGIYTENIAVNKRLTIKSENGAATTIVQAENSNDHVFEVTADCVNLSGFRVEGAVGGYPLSAGIFLEADYCNIANNIILNNYDGLCLRYSLNNRITSNIISDNTRHGIELDWDCNYNTIYGNSISLNEGGLSLDSSSNNVIYNNTINANRGSGGISFYSASRNNRIYLNNFVNNSKNAISLSSLNAWNSPGKITYTYNSNTYTNYLGNYWSDYTGYDLNHDGIGDRYSERDSYPLIEPWEKYFGLIKSFVIAQNHEDQ